MNDYTLTDEELEPNEFVKWFNTFLKEKKLPFIEWEIDHDRETNWIDSDFVIETIKICHPNEQAKIKNTIVQIDFNNGDVNHFFKHLAKGIVSNY